MSAEKTVTLYCDGNCGGTVATDESTATGARKIAASLGWSNRLGKDWCRSCRIERGERPHKPKGGKREVV